MRERSQKNLPDEVIVRIFKELEASDLLNVGMVCKKWLSISEEDVVWMEKWYSVVLYTNI
jgi:hypothetical protein